MKILNVLLLSISATITFKNIDVLEHSETTSAEAQTSQSALDAVSSVEGKSMKVNFVLFSLKCQLNQI